MEYLAISTNVMQMLSNTRRGGCRFCLSARQQRWNRVTVFDPWPDPTRSLSIVKQILDNGLIAVSVSGNTNRLVAYTQTIIVACAGYKICRPYFATWSWRLLQQKCMHCARCKKRRMNTDRRRHFFSERIINWWNKLDRETVCVSTVNNFKNNNHIHITQPSAKYMYLYMYLFWSRAHRQRHVITCLMKFAVGERNVAIRYIYFALGCVIWLWIWLSCLIQPDERLQTSTSRTDFKDYGCLWALVH